MINVHIKFLLHLGFQTLIPVYLWERSFLIIQNEVSIGLLKADIDLLQFILYPVPHRKSNKSIFHFVFQIMFKMDINGNGVLIEKNDLNKAVKLRDDFYTFEKFRYLCILSGCDYLPSISGIGLVKAAKVFKLTKQTDMKQVCQCLNT